MTGTSSAVARLAGGLIVLLWVAGCRYPVFVEAQSVSAPAAVVTVAVAPAINQSGSSDFDPNAIADLMASELARQPGVLVIPVSRVLGALATQGLTQVGSDAHALDLLGMLGADAILVFAVTEYEPYAAPIVGISAQLYGTWPGTGRRELDPVALSRSPVLPSGMVGSDPRRLLAQTQAIFDASDVIVAEDVRNFAVSRRADQSPFGWRKFVVSQRHFVRYCCDATVRALIGALNADRQAGR